MRRTGAGASDFRRSRMPYSTMLVLKVEVSTADH